MTNAYQALVSTTAAEAAVSRLTVMLPRRAVTRMTITAAQRRQRLAPTWVLLRPGMTGLSRSGEARHQRVHVRWAPSLGKFDVGPAGTG
ncbi:hypothetical protein ACWEPL_61250 [Nonomuraea sp. NPDC004186]